MRIPRHLLLGLASWLVATIWQPAHAAECPPAGHTKASLQALKTAKFVLPDIAAKRSLIDDLVACLASPDPELRDGIVYEALTQWMRAGDFDADGLRALRDQLYPMLAGDQAGFAAPFAALMLSEVARTDRVKPWMGPDERATMVERAAAYVESVRDYRGYIEGEGWRHGVAHGADWLMQLTLNPALDKPQLTRILAAIATQVVPSDAHAYVFGEPARLARPVLFVAQRNLLTDEEWHTWFTALSPRTGDRNVDDAGGVARRHDLQAFLTAMYMEADQSDNAGVKSLKPAIIAALRQE